MELQEAFDAFVEAFYPYTISDTLAGHTSCGEHAVFVELFIAGGREDLVPALLQMHIEGDDDCEDEHHAEYLALTGKRCCQHKHRPDDSPESGDRCKDCGEPITVGRPQRERLGGQQGSPGHRPAAAPASLTGPWQPVPTPLAGV